jgi:recombinational DNA repair protein (RecF pathway)
LLRALHALETTRPERVALCFAFRAVDLLGHRPRLDRCRGCGVVPSARVWFDAASGGILCASCPTGRESHPLSVQALSGLRRLRGLRWEERLLTEFPLPLEREMLATVEGYMVALIGSVPKTGRFLEQTQERVISGRAHAHDRAL